MLNRLLVFICFGVATVSANSSSLAWDPFGFRNIGVAEAVDGLRTLQAQFGRDISLHIAELDRLATARTDQAFDRADAIVTLVIKEANLFVECEPPILLNEIEGTLSKIKLLGFPVLRRPSNKARDTSAFEIYRAARDDLTQALSEVNAETPGEVVVAFYDEMARLAKRTQCIYRGQPTGELLIRKHYFPNVLKAAEWAKVIN